MRRGPRRIAAFALDELVVGLWIGALTLAAALARAAGWLGDPAPPAGIAAKAAGHAASLLALTLPVLLYLSLLEARRGATLGKRALGLEVVGTDDRPLSTRRALLRNAVKLAPWEFSHLAIWYVPGRPFLDPPPAWSLAAWLLSLAAAAVYLAALFVGEGRTPYDRVARSRVRLAARRTG